MREFKIQQRTLIGIAIMIVGGLLLLSSMGILDSNLSIGSFWPVILIVLGIVRIINYDESTYTGIIFLILGVYFQLRNFNVEILRNVGLAKLFWPAIIIMFGVSLILPEKYKSKSNKESYDYRDDSIDVEYTEQD